MLKMLTINLNKVKIVILFKLQKRINQNKKI